MDDFYTDFVHNPNLLNCMDTNDLPALVEKKKMPGLFSGETKLKIMTKE